MIGAHVARIAGFRLASLFEVERMARVACDATVAIWEARGINVFLLLLTPVFGVRPARLSVAGVAPHLHDLPRHLLIVRHSDVPLPVDTEVTRAGAVGMTGIEDGFLIDLLVAGTTRCLRHATLRRHDLVVVRPMAGSTRHLWRRKLHARVLDSSLAHRADFELRHDCRVESAMAFRTRSLSEHAMRNISAQPRWRWGYRSQVGMNQLRVRV